MSSGSTVAQLLRGSLVTQLLSVAATLQLADILQEGPKTARELAAAAAADTTALYRVLRALAAMGIFVERPDGRFEMTPLAEPLRCNAPDSLGASAALYGTPWWWTATGALLHSVKTGETAFKHVHGMPLFEYLEHHTEAAAVFNAHQSNMTQQDAGAIIAAYAFTGYHRVVDVGGGHGTLLAAILEACPETRGVLFDMPSVVSEAGCRLAQSLSGRCEIVAGDFFKAVPSGGDVYVLKDIVHDWDDERAVAILRNCRAALTDRENSKILVIEKVIPPRNDPFPGKMTDITMLLVTGGRERTEPEYRSLLTAAGLTVTRIVPTRSPASVIEAVPT